MTREQKRKTSWTRPLLAAALVAAPVTFALTRAPEAKSSDHGDTAENVARIGADLTDLYVFPSPQNANNVVLVMNVHGLIPAGQGLGVAFDPNVLYQFKIDNSGDAVEDLVIQTKFEGNGTGQRVLVAGPVRPSRTGTSSVFEGSLASAFATAGTINRPFTQISGMRVFAGAREDPFFFDLERFYQIFPDRITPIQPPRRTEDIDIPDPNTPRVNGWRPKGQARDFFNNLNVLSVVVEVPRSSLVRRAGSRNINVWMTTSVAASRANAVPSPTPVLQRASFEPRLQRVASSSTIGEVFIQQDRLARPAINEVLATVSFDRHRINNRIAPTDDPNQVARDIRGFYKFPAGRSDAIADAAVSVLVPDVMKVDLSQPGPASYLGVETGGFTGGKFGGRKLSDDVVDIDLGAVFGNTIPALGLAPNDGKALPQFTSDNVGPQNNELPTFPYLAPPA